jgi:hypothetical protein
MKPPTVAMVRCTKLCSLPLYSSTAAIAHAVVQGDHLRHVGHGDALAADPGNRSAHGDGADDKSQVEGGSANENENQRRESGEQHAETGPPHAAHRGNRRTHALEPENEQRGRDEIGQLRERLNGRCGRHG